MIIALLDACVLYPPALRDLFMWLAVDMLYQPRWTEEIHDEWMRNVLADRPELSRSQLERTRRLMDKIDENCLVYGYEALIPTLSLPDTNDRHVLAAAIEAKAAQIVTFNLSDFPITKLRPYGVRAVHPDMFLCALFDDNAAAFLRTLQTHRASLKRPPKTAEEYLETFRINKLTKLAQRVELQLTAI